MDLLLRRRWSDDAGETVDHLLSGATVTLDARESADFQLPGLPGSITVAATGKDRLRLTGKGHHFSLQGKSVSRVDLAPGEEAEFAGLILRSFAAPTGFDRALEMVGEPRRDAREPRLLQEIRPWSMRGLSWVLLLAMLSVLLIPLLVEFGPAGALEDLPGIPSDALWSSGPLSAVHQAAGLNADCGSCHDTPFRMVEDRSCLGCHQDITAHSDPEAHPRHSLSEARCAGCHREHNEPEWLVHNDDRLCSDCHATPGEWDGDTELEAVHSFTAGGHAAFRLSLWQPRENNAALGWELRRYRDAASNLEDRSGLKFNHAVHMDAEKVREPQSDETLVCASCHTLRDDGEHFEQISMDGHCRGCHTLNFDPFDPDIELPHGNTRAAFEAMEAHFIREFTDPVLRAERVQSKPRRLPGKRMSAASCEGDGLTCGRGEAEKEALYQFAESGCVTCHEVEDTDAAAAIDRWLVHPIRLTTDFYSEARFDHGSHLSLGAESGDAACGGCHEAAESESAREVLMPGLDNCLDCHSAGLRQAPSECISCHQLHRRHAPLWVDARLRGVAP